MTPAALLHLGSLRGRATRREFAWVFLTCFALALAALFTPWPRGHVGVALAVASVELVLSYLTLAVFVRRLHDLGKTGWYLLLWPIPMVGVVLLAWFFARPSASQA